MLTDPLVHHGRHFGRAVHTFCNLKALLANGLLCHSESNEASEPAALCVLLQFSPLKLMAWIRVSREYRVFLELLSLCPHLEERLLRSSEEEIQHVAEMVSARPISSSCSANDGCMQIQKGVNAARADDTKGLKIVIVDWITPPGQALEPPISRKIKSTRGFHHERTGALLCPAGIDWSNPTCASSSLLLCFFSQSSIQGQRRSSVMGRCRSAAISGRCFSMLTSPMILMILGMASSETSC
jgi:hypothetical protein